MDKRESEIRHATRRAKERYALTLSKGDFKEITRDITTGNSSFIKKVSNTRSVHDVLFKGITLRVVYDKLRKCIVTFLHVR
jgi:ABC-type iron transport system FetAB ATPase subunit